ncbi:hypothetical protein J6590_102796, partial [Homalodisca vitripennis]
LSRDVSRELACWCPVKVAAKWQWPVQGIERTGECRAVVGIQGEGGITAADGYLPHPA